MSEIVTSIAVVAWLAFAVAVIIAIVRGGGPR